MLLNIKMNRCVSQLLDTTDESGRRRRGRPKVNARALRVYWRECACGLYWRVCACGVYWRVCACGVYWRVCACGVFWRVCACGVYWRVCACGVYWRVCACGVIGVCVHVGCFGVCVHVDASACAIPGNCLTIQYESINTQKCIVKTKMHQLAW
jgi:hypothetical protein